MEVYPWQLQQLEKSETYRKWVPLSCRDFHLLKTYRECINKAPPAGTDPYFFANRPIDSVYMAGTMRDPAIAQFGSTTLLFFQLDDGSGPTVSVVKENPYRRDCRNIDGRFVEIWGHIRFYKKRGYHEVKARSMVLPAPNLAREIDIKYEALRVREMVLLAPWTVPEPEGRTDIYSQEWEDAKEPTQYISLSRANSVLVAHKEFSLLETIDSLEPENGEPESEPASSQASAQSIK